MPENQVITFFILNAVIIEKERMKILTTGNMYKNIQI